MDSLVVEAQNELAGNTDSREDTPLRMRWQQRGLFRDRILQYVEMNVQLNTELRTETNDEYDPSSTRDTES